MQERNNEHSAHYHGLLGNDKSVSPCEENSAERNKGRSHAEQRRKEKTVR